MIKPEEIRKGVFISILPEGMQTDFNWRTVSGVDKDDDGWYVILDRFGDKPLDECYGIKLTKSIVKQFGFKETDPLYFKDDQFHVCFTDSKIHFGMFEHHIKEIKYIHELQNIYYAITQKELLLKC